MKLFGFALLSGLIAAIDLEHVQSAAAIMASSCVVLYYVRGYLSRTFEKVASIEKAAAAVPECLRRLDDLDKQLTKLASQRCPFHRVPKIVREEKPCL